MLRPQRHFYLASAAAALAASAVRSVTDCESPTTNTQRKIAMYFSPKAKTDLTDHFAKRLHSSASISPHSVVLKDNCSDTDSYFYEPLFGDACAFRLKGLIKTKDGSVVGLGRVSSMIGELREEDYEVSVLLSSNGEVSSTRLSELLRLPTTLKNENIALNDEIDDLGCGVWEGKLMRSTNDKEFEDVVYTKLPWFRQIVLDGVLCDSKYVDKHGICKFDRKRIVRTTRRRSSSVSAAASAPSAAASAASGASETDKRYRSRSLFLLVPLSILIEYFTSP